MTLKETIKYIRLKANEQKYYASFVKKKDVLQSCKEKAEQYQQIVDWLEELKTFKEKFAEILLYDHEIAERKIYEKAYNDAIDDFTKKIAGYGTYDDYGNVIDILEIAEELKKHHR